MTIINTPLTVTLATGIRLTRNGTDMEAAEWIVRLIERGHVVTAIEHATPEEIANGDVSRMSGTHVMYSDRGGVRSGVMVETHYRTLYDLTSDCTDLTMPDAEWVFAEIYDNAEGVDADFSLWLIHDGEVIDYRTTEAR